MLTVVVLYNHDEIKVFFVVVDYKCWLLVYLKGEIIHKLPSDPSSTWVNVCKKKEKHPYNKLSFTLYTLVNTFMYHIQGLNSSKCFKGLMFYCKISIHLCKCSRGLSMLFFFNWKCRVSIVLFCYALGQFQTILILKQQGMPNLCHCCLF